jgi:hypothetical protein
MEDPGTHPATECMRPASPFIEKVTKNQESVAQGGSYVMVNSGSGGGNGPMKVGFYFSF